MENNHGKKKKSTGPDRVKKEKEKNAERREQHLKSRNKTSTDR